jgi:serine/threonine protein kinase
VFFLKTKEERDMWLQRLNEAGRIRQIYDSYELSDHILGQGSYGKVIKGKDKTTGKQVAIK